MTLLHTLDLDVGCQSHHNVLKKCKLLKQIRCILVHSYSKEYAKPDGITVFNNYFCQAKVHYGVLARHWWGNHEETKDLVMVLAVNTTY